VHQRIFEVHERIPVRPGRITLLHPEWQLGAHAPNGPALSQFTGLILSGNRQRIEWQRDPYNVYAFHAQVPAGVSEPEAPFEFLSPTEGGQGAVLASEEMVAVHWESLLLYPAGHFAHGILFKPSVRFPPGWQSAGALEVAAQDNAGVHYKPIDLEQLVDSPT